MKTFTSPLYEVRLYLGAEPSRWMVPQPIETFNRGSVIKQIGKFQESYEGTTVPVRVTDTVFVSETNYTEEGWEVAAINYPRTNHSHTETLGFMLALAEYLLKVFLQKRICVLDCHPNSTDNIHMLEIEHGEERV